MADTAQDFQKEYRGAVHLFVTGFYNWKFILQLMLLPVFIFFAVYIFSKQDAYIVSSMVAPAVWVVWAAVKRSPASIVSAIVLISLIALIISLIINPVALSLTLTSFVMLPLFAAGVGAFLSGISVALMGLKVFMDLFKYRKLNRRGTSKPVLSTEFKEASNTTVLKQINVWFGTNLVNGKRGELKLYKNKLMFIKNGEQAEFEYKFSDIRGVVISPSEILINMKTGKKFSATFFDRTNLIFVALISFAAMALLSLKIGFISIFIVYAFIFYGISTRYKYQAETQEWKRALHNFVDIEEMSGYPMGISFRKFILLVVLILIAAFCLAVLISGSY